QLVHRFRAGGGVGQAVDSGRGGESGEHARGGKADAGGTAGYQGRLAGEIVADHVPSIGLIARNACFSFRSLRSRSRNSSSGGRSPQSKNPLPAMTPLRPSAISLSRVTLRPRTSGGV